MPLSNESIAGLANFFIDRTNFLTASEFEEKISDTLFSGFYTNFLAELDSFSGIIRPSLWYCSAENEENLTAFVGGSATLEGAKWLARQRGFEEIEIVQYNLKESIKNKTLEITFLIHQKDKTTTLSFSVPQTYGKSDAWYQNFLNKGTSADKIIWHLVQQLYFLKVKEVSLNRIANYDIVLEYKSLILVVEVKKRKDFSSENSFISITENQAKSLRYFFGTGVIILSIAINARDEVFLLDTDSLESQLEDELQNEKIRLYGYRKLGNISELKVDKLVGPSKYLEYSTERTREIGRRIFSAEDKDTNEIINNILDENSVNHQKEYIKSIIKRWTGLNDYGDHGEYGDDM